MNKMQRLDEKFLKDMRDVGIVRVSKGLAGMSAKEHSVREMTRLITRTEAYQRVLEELRTKPKR